MFVNHDLLTISPNSSSKVVGVAEAVSITSSLDGLANVVMGKITLELKHYNVVMLQIIFLIVLIEVLLRMVSRKLPLIS